MIKGGGMNGEQGDALWLLLGRSDFADVHVHLPQGFTEGSLTYRREPDKRLRLKRNPDVWLPGHNRDESSGD